MQRLDLQEQQALFNLTTDPLYASALKKFFSNHEEYYTLKARQSLNVVPKDLHEQAKENAQAKQYAAMAKAWGTGWAELEKAAKV